MYGLEGILGNLITSVATPAIGGLAGEAAGNFLTKTVEDEAQKQLLKEMTQTTVGALSGAAVGAGLGALTGGKAGAVSGLITGGVGGGLGGYNAQDISGIFGGQQSVGAPQGTQIQPTADSLQTRANLSGLPGEPSMLPQYQGAAQNLASTAPAQPSGFKGYLDFLKKNYEPLAGGFFVGSAYGANQDTEQMGKQYKQQQALKDLIDQRNALSFARSIYGYADGGPVEVGLASPEISVHFPAWAQEKIQREGGLAAIQPGLSQGLANGGYINTQQVNPDNFYPQSQMPKAAPYAAASPIRHEVLNNFAHGGLINGPGDGMSDSIDANISGKEPVKVADGEYVIPREIAAKYGPEKLKHMMTKVRAAAHAKKGKQIQQDAAKRALITTLGGIKA